MNIEKLEADITCNLGKLPKNKLEFELPNNIEISIDEKRLPLGDGSNSLTTEISAQLYRYDLNQPPANWDPSFLNFEYDTTEHGHKNKANLFFLTDSSDTAKSLGAAAANKHFKEKYFLTSTMAESIKLINFTNRYNIYQMLCLLQDLNLDVLTSEFRTYENENDFGQLKPFWESAQLESNLNKKWYGIKNLRIHSKSNFDDIALFGQRLTDFNNGLKFKKMIKEKYPDIDGYVWDEFNDARGFSYCLFDSNKLGHIKAEIIEVKNVK